MSTSLVAGSGPLAVLSAGAAALARATDLDTALAVIVEAGAAAVGAPMAAVFGQDPERGGWSCSLTLGMDETAIATFEAEPSSTTRITRSTGRRSIAPARWDAMARCPTARR